MEQDLERSEEKVELSERYVGCFASLSTNNLSDFLNNQLIAIADHVNCGRFVCGFSIESRALSDSADRLKAAARRLVGTLESFANAFPSIQWRELGDAENTRQPPQTDREIEYFRCSF